MNTNACHQFLNQLDEWMEGERPPDCRDHVRECANCRALVGDLDAIRKAAVAWAGAEAEPPARIWPALRAQLEQEGLIRTERRSWARSLADFLGGAFTVVPRPALAGAYLAAMIAVAVALVAPVARRPEENRWIAGTRSLTQPLSAELATAETDTVSSLASANPAVIASLHQNLAIVDNYIALCEKSVLEEPENEFARDYLYDAYQQKAALLEQMTERGEYGQ